MTPSPTLPSTVILVRHGHVEGISPERFRGRSDLALTALGKKQAEETARYIAATWSVDAIYSSPLHRCVDTANAIAEHQEQQLPSKSLTVQPLEQLIDIDYGIWQGALVEQVKSDHPELYDRWLKYPQLTVIENGETLADVQARIARAFNHMSHEHPGGTILAVGHDSSIRIFLSLLLDLPLSSYWRIKQEPCAVNVLKLEEGTYQIRALNSRAHLTEA